MKRLIGILALAAMGIGGLFAAGQRQDGAVKPGDRVVLKVLANVDNSTTDGVDWGDIVTQFEAENPDVDVQDITAYGEPYHQKARAMLAAKDFPHVADIWPDARGAYFKEAGQLVDMRPYMDASYYDFSVIPPMGPNGEVYEVPVGAANYCSVLFMNEELLKKHGLEAPKTYEDLAAMVEPLKKVGVMVVSMDGVDGWVWGSCFMSGVAARITGDGEFIQKAVRGEYKFTDPRFVRALAFIATAVRDGVLPASAMVTDYGTALTNFITGRAAFMIDGQWRTNEITDPDFQKGVKLIPFPQLPGESEKMKNSVAAALTMGMGITKVATEDSKVLDAALRFIKAVYSPANVTRRWVNGTIVAPTIFLDRPAELPPIVLEKNRFSQNVGPLTDVIDSYLPAAANDALNIGMQNIALGKTTPEAVAAEVEGLVRGMK